MISRARRIGSRIVSASSNSSAQVWLHKVISSAFRSGRSRMRDSSSTLRPRFTPESRSTLSSTSTSWHCAYTRAAATPIASQSLAISASERPVPRGQSVQITGILRPCDRLHRSNLQQFCKCSVWVTPHLTNCRIAGGAPTVCSMTGAHPADPTAYAAVLLMDLPDRVLLVQHTGDRTWSLPGTWVAADESPLEAGRGAGAAEP